MLTIPAHGKAPLLSNWTATWLMHQILRHSTKSSIQGCTNFTWSTTPYLPLQQLWNDASVQLAASPVLVGPACQMTCLKLCWLLSVIKTFCDLLVSSDYQHWQQRQFMISSFHSDSLTGLTTVITYYLLVEIICWEIAESFSFDLADTIVTSTLFICTIKLVRYLLLLLSVLSFCGKLILFLIN